MKLAYVKVKYGSLRTCGEKRKEWILGAIDLASNAGYELTAQAEKILRAWD